MAIAQHHVRRVLEIISVRVCEIGGCRVNIREQFKTVIFVTFYLGGRFTSRLFRATHDAQVAYQGTYATFFNDEDENKNCFSHFILPYTTV